MSATTDRYKLLPSVKAVQAVKLTLERGVNHTKSSHSSTRSCKLFLPLRTNVNMLWQNTMLLHLFTTPGWIYLTGRILPKPFPFLLLSIYLSFPNNYFFLPTYTIIHLQQRKLNVTAKTTLNIVCVCVASFNIPRWSSGFFTHPRTNWCHWYLIFYPHTVRKPMIPMLPYPSTNHLFLVPSC